MGLNFNELYKLGTDVAAFVFFDDKELAHRKKDPLDWWTKDFQTEFIAGRLVAFSTGADRVFTLKFVERPLTAAETRALVISESFRYHAANGRVYWDNTDHLPSADQLDQAEKDPDGWLEIPTGRYKVTVNAIDWFSIPAAEREAEKDISHYIVQFERVESFDQVTFPRALPWLGASKQWLQKRLAQQTVN